MVRSRSVISAGCASEPCVEMSSSSSVHGDAQSSRILPRGALVASAWQTDRQTEKRAT